MEKNLKDQLIFIESEFKSSNWRKQLMFIEFLNSNELENDSVSDSEEPLEEFIDIIVAVNEYYLKTNFNEVKNLITGTLTENILIKGLLFNLHDRWWMREYSLILNDYSKEEKIFLLDEIIAEVYMRRTHKSSKIITKHLKKEFDKQYDSTDILKCLKLIIALIEKFLDKNATYNSFIGYMNRETLFNTETSSEIINKLFHYQKDLELVYIFKNVNRIIDSNQIG